MSQNIRNLVEDVVASPLGEVIASVGRAVADAQQALDDAALAKTLEIYGEQGEEALRLLREIGYRPTFYTLPETTGEVRVSLSLTGGSSAAGTPAPPQPGVNLSFARQGLNLPAIRPKVYATPVDASFANRFGYQANLSAKLTFKIVPVPAPNGADELRIVPDFVNPPAGSEGSSVTFGDAQRLAAEFSLELHVVNGEGEVVEEPDRSATIASQEPVAGSYARMGDSITLTLA